MNIFRKKFSNVWLNNILLWNVLCRCFFVFLKRFYDYWIFLVEIFFFEYLRTNICKIFFISSIFMSNKFMENFHLIEVVFVNVWWSNIFVNHLYSVENVFFRNSLNIFCLSNILWSSNNFVPNIFIEFVIFRIFFVKFVFRSNIFEVIFLSNKFLSNVWLSNIFCQICYFSNVVSSNIYYWICFCGLFFLL